MVSPEAEDCPGSCLARSRPPVAPASPLCADILPVPESAGRCYVYRLLQRQGLRLALITFSVAVS